VHNLIAKTALGGTEAHVDTIAGLTISECPDWALASVSARMGKAKTMGTAFKKAMGSALPKPLQSNTKDGVTTFWVGPDQYFVEGPMDTHELLADTLNDALKQNASVTEQSGGWVRFDLEGVGCDDTLERLCNFDTRGTADGSVTRTALEHSGCFVMKRNAKHFSVYGPRSTAGSIHHALVTAATSALG
jgi:sarcosine oxidase subunit gamma